MHFTYKNKAAEVEADLLLVPLDWHVKCAWNHLPVRVEFFLETKTPCFYLDESTWSESRPGISKTHIFVERFGEFLISNEQTLRWEHMQVPRVDGWKQFGSSNFEVVEDVKRRLGGSVSVRWRCPFFQILVPRMSHKSWYDFFAEMIDEIERIFHLFGVVKLEWNCRLLENKKPLKVPFERERHCGILCFCGAELGYFFCPLWLWWSSKLQILFLLPGSGSFHHPDFARHEFIQMRLNLTWPSCCWLGFLCRERSYESYQIPSTLRARTRSFPWGRLQGREVAVLFCGESHEDGFAAAVAVAVDGVTILTSCGVCVL